MIGMHPIFAPVPANQRPPTLGPSDHGGNFPSQRLDLHALDCKVVVRLESGRQEETNGTVTDQGAMGPRDQHRGSPDIGRHRV